MIHAENLSKRYTIYDQPIHRLYDWCTPRTWRRRGTPFWALRNVSLQIGKATSLGIVGVNGAGKTTLLKLITGTTVPTSGAYRVEGRVSALLELGTGFQLEFTGRENIEINGKLTGLTSEELTRKTPSIIEFSELGPFIDQPLRTYSSGMTMRLAFAIASSVEPDVLIVDEALSVGDIHFQHKCLARIRRIRESGVTVLFVSHDPALVKSFCDQAILLDAGELIDSGSPDDVLDHYNALLAEKYRDDGPKARIIRPREISSSVPKEDDFRADLPSTQDAAETADSEPEANGDKEPKIVTGHRTGNFLGAITRVEVRSEGTAGNASLITPGMEVTILVRAVCLEKIESPTIGIIIKDRLGNEVYGVNTYFRGLDLGRIEPGQAIEAEFTAPMQLGDGVYSITAALHEGPTHTTVCYDWIEHAATFQVLPTPTDPFTGVCRLAMDIRHRQGAAEPEELELAQSIRKA